MSTSAEKSPKPSSTATRAPGDAFFPAARGGGFFPAVTPTTPSAFAVQAKLTVSKPGDSLEKEADRAAEHVMRMPPPVATTALVQTGDNSVSRAGVGVPDVSTDTQSAIHKAATGGRPLSPDVREFVEPRLGADFGRVRIHTDREAASLTNRLSARAFTHRNHIFFGRDQYQPGSTDGRQLLAHELTHTIQQGHSAQSSTVQRTPKVTTTASPPAVQRLGIQDALDYFADKAYYIPGFRMLTLVLGFNPINMRSADRTAANLLRALIELIPGGAVITQTLDNHGVINKAAAWVEQKIATLGDIGAQIVDGLKRFIDSLGWRDIFHLGDVWDRAKRIFTDPIGRLISFGVSVVTEILKMVKDAILRPLAALAGGTRGYDLLKAILGQDPITGEPVPRNADTLIGGFMKLIGQEEVWENLKKGNAVARAWAWFQNALTGLMGLVLAVPRRIIDTLRSLTFQDVITVAGAFRKVVGAFVNIATDFISWGVKQVLSLLEILFSVVAPRVMPYIAKAKAAFHTIIRDPVRFVGNLVRAGRLGFQMFANNIVEHLKTALIKWLTGPLGEAGVYIPKSFTLLEVVKLVLSVLGLTWQNVRTKLLKIIPEPVLTALEKTAKILVTLVTEGPAAAWEQIKSELTELKDQLIGQVTQMITTEVVKAAVFKLVSMLNPAGAVIQAIIATYNTVTFFIEKINQIAAVVASFIDSIAAIAAGQVQGAAKKVEQTMANTLTVIIAFLAKFVGLGNVPTKLVGIVKKIRQPIDKGLDRIVGWLGGLLQKAKGVAKAGVAAAAEGLQSVRKKLLGLVFRERFQVNDENHSVFTEEKEPGILYTASNKKRSKDAVDDPSVAASVAEFESTMKQYRQKVDEFASATDSAENVSRLKKEASALKDKAKALQLKVVEATRKAMGKSPNMHAPGIGTVAPHHAQLPRLRRGKAAKFEVWEMESEHVIPRMLASSYFATLPVADKDAKVSDSEYNAMYTVLMYRQASKGKTSTAKIGDLPEIATLKREIDIAGLAAVVSKGGLQQNVQRLQDTAREEFEGKARKALERAGQEAIAEQTRVGDARGKGAPALPTAASLQDAFNKQGKQIAGFFAKRLALLSRLRKQ